MFDHAMFVPGDSVYSSVKPGAGATADVSWQLRCAHAWEALLGPVGQQQNSHSAFEVADGSGDDLRVSLGGSHSHLIMSLLGAARSAATC